MKAPSDGMHEFEWPDSDDSLNAETVPLGEKPPRKANTPALIRSKRCEYRQVARLGGGGFGSVHLADALPRTEDFQIPPRVAVKIYHSNLFDEKINLVRREISAMRAINHPRIPRLYDWSLSDGQPFLVMHFYDRGSMGGVAGVPIALETGWRLLRDTLEALVVSHRASLLHLDIKPENILLDGEGGFVLADFGISQSLLASKDVMTPGLGTRGFQAPEQSRMDASSIDTRTDLYGVGATVWSLLSGLKPGKLPDAMPAIAEGASLPKLRDVRSDVPESLDRIVMSLLSVDRNGRPGSAAEALAWVNSVSSESAGTDYKAPLKKSSGSSEEVSELLESLIDPIWRDVANSKDAKRLFRKFQDGEALGLEGEDGYRAFVLLQGQVEISREGRSLVVENREGTFLGEVAALTGLPRSATMRAVGVVWALSLNPAELENLAAKYPSLAIRLMKSMAERVSREGKQ